MLLVGGFSASPYLQDRARDGLRAEEGGPAPMVITMEEPYAAVLQGMHTNDPGHPKLDLSRKVVNWGC